MAGPPARPRPPCPGARLAIAAPTGSCAPTPLPPSPRCSESAGRIALPPRAHQARPPPPALSKSPRNRRGRPRRSARQLEFLWKTNPINNVPKSGVQVGSWTPKKSVLHRTVSAIRAETWEAINRILLVGARQEKVVAGKAVRRKSPPRCCGDKSSDSSLRRDALSYSGNWMTV